MKRKRREEKRKAKEKVALTAAEARRAAANRQPARTKIKLRLTSIVQARQERENQREAAIEAKRLAAEKRQGEDGD